MDPFSIVLLLVAGVAAGAINAAVGSGSLLTLPVLMATGLPPGVAVRTNTVGMVFSTIGSVIGFRREIAAERQHLGPLSLFTLIGALAGSCLLLFSSSGALDIVVPVLIVVALIMVVGQPRLTRYLKQRQADASSADSPGTTSAGTTHNETTQTKSPQSDTRSPYRRARLIAPMTGAAVYGGYFTAAQGVLYMGILAIGTGRKLGDINPVKNLLSLVVNATAAVVYLIAHFLWGAEIYWLGSLLVAIGSLIGGYFGSHIAKRLPDPVLRGVIVVVAVAALIRQFV